MLTDNPVVAVLNEKMNHAHCYQEPASIDMLSYDCLRNKFR